MYVWIGIDVDSQLLEIKERVREIENEIRFVNSVFTLPLHISLKISFAIEDNIFESVKNDLLSVFATTESFNIDVSGIEHENNICWIRMQRSAHLDTLHDKLNVILLEKYGVPLHDYDMDYKFHTTLFMDNDFVKVQQAYNELGNASVPSTLIANKFVIGTSESGALGTYKVVYEYKNSGLN